jgi:protein-disulfide isomerase
MPQDAVEKIVRDYLLKHPEIVVEAIETYKRKQAEMEEATVRQTIATRKNELFDDPHAAVGGNPRGDVTLVEFFDYRCGVCKRVHPIVAEVMKRDGGVRRVYKEWPILGPESLFASKAAIASRRQGEEKYLSFHDAMMEHRGALNRDAVLRIATAVGLDTKRLVADLAAPEVERVIQRNFSLAEALRLNGTPSFVIGETVLRGGRGVETLLSIVREARKKG